MLIEKYPNLLKDNEIFKLIQKALENEDNFRKRAFQDILNQCFVVSATWGLDEWEELAGLPISRHLKTRIRRQNILNALQNRETTTVKVIKNLAESYSGGECEVTEQNSEYKFTIKFIGVRGEPDSLPALREAIERVKPAHLRYDFIFTYMTWDECTRYHKTWNKWEELNLTWHEFERYWQGYMAEFLEWQMFDNYKNTCKNWDDMWITWDDLEIYV